MFEAITNALNNIVGFFKSIYDFIIDIPKAIYDFFTTGFKLIFEGLKNLTILLFNVVVELWNWIADVIKSIFINPILNFIHDLTDRINRKLDGIIFILIGVPIIYKQFEDFIKEPKKKKIGWLILSPIALYVLSKTIASWVRKRKYTPIAIPSFRLEKPEELKKNIAVIDHKDVLFEDYAVVTKGLPFIARSDSLINDSFGYSFVKRNMVFVNVKDRLVDGDAVDFRKALMIRLEISFSDRLVDDIYTFITGQFNNIYLTHGDELFGESLNIVSSKPIVLSSDSLVYDSVDIETRLPVTLSQSDNLFVDNQSYSLYNMGIIANSPYLDNAYYSTDIIANSPYLDNTYYSTDIIANSPYLDNAYYSTDIIVGSPFIDNAGAFFDYIKLSISDNMLSDTVDIEVQVARYPINVSFSDSLLDDRGQEFSTTSRSVMYPINVSFSDSLLDDQGAYIYITSQPAMYPINISFTDSLLVDQGPSIFTRTMRNLSLVDASLIDMGAELIVIVAVKMLQSDIAIGDNVNITTEPRGIT